METNKTQVVIGVDVSKAKLDIYHSLTGEHCAIENQPRHIGQYLSTVKKQWPNAIVVFEPTGGYEKKLIYSLLAKDVTAYTLHPNKVLNFKKCEGDKAKTDKIDAIYIAQYAQSYPSHLVAVDESYIDNKKLSELYSIKQQLKAELLKINNRAETEPYNSKIVKKHYREQQKHFLKELKRIDDALQDAINHSEENAEKTNILTSMKGVGRETAEAMICCVPELGTLGRTQISKLIGVAPVNQDSGKKQGKRSIYGGRAHVRKILYMAAFSASRFNPVLRDAFRQLRERGKPFKVAIVAIMRRMICMMNAMIRENQPWQDTNQLVIQKA